MTKTYFWLYFLTLSGLIFSTKNANAQTTYQPSDRSPVADSTLVGTQVTNNGNGNFDITGGLNRGQTLFHSFQDFSVPTNGAANFANPAGIRDIISRVTGGSFSDINGRINSNGANFFLINPNGIVFGPNVQLNVGRAFMASTANGINLVDAGGRAITFGTNPNGGEPLLTISPNVFFNVSSLNMGGGSGQISNFGTLQTTNPNQYIGLIGGNVSMNGGIIDARGGRVDLGGLSAPGIVRLDVQGNNLRAQFPTNVARGDVSLTKQASVYVVGAGGGEIAVDARNIDILGSSFLSGGILPGFGTSETIAGDIKLDATGEIVIGGFSSGIVNNVNLNASGKGGNIDIKSTGNIKIFDILDSQSSLLLDSNRVLSTISSSTLGKGSTGKITIDTTGDITLSNGGQIFAATGNLAEGNNQGIEIKNARNLTLNNKAVITTNNFSAINAGSIDIKTTGNIDISTLSNIASNNSGKGGAGDIIINTKGDINMSDRGSILAASLGEGKAGNISVSSQKINLLNKSFISNLGYSVSGGDITLSVSDRLLLRNDSSIVTDSGSSKKNGNGGNININSPLIIATPGNNDITANAYAGNGGKVTITSQGLFGIKYRPVGSDFTNDITASSTFGQIGKVNINTPGTDPGKDSTTLPTVPTDASNQISQACSASNRQNKFTVAGRGGMPPNANEPLTSDVVWQDARATNNQPAANSTTNNSPKYPPPAVGLVFDGKGKAFLVAAATEGQPTGTNVTCPQAKEQFRIRDRETEQFRIRD